MGIWEQVLVGALAVGIVFLFWPGVKAAMERSQQAEDKDWMAVIVPVGLVVLFVVFLLVVSGSGG